MKNKITLRDYQQESIDNVYLNFNKHKINRQLICLPTASGKTVIASELTKLCLNNNKKVFILSHREEITEQLAETIQSMVGSKYRVGIEKAELKSSKKDNVVIASVQTVGRNNSNRIEKFKPKEFGLILTDECHHAASDTYTNVYDHFGVGPNNNENKSLLNIGITATPNRSDGQGLDKIYDKIAIFRTMEDMIDAGWLCPIKAFTIKTNEKLKVNKTNSGDFNNKELEKQLNTKKRNNIICETYEKYCLNTKTIIFCLNKKHAQQIGLQLKEDLNIKVAVLTDDTSKERRKSIIENFENGKIECVCNVQILTEGYDFPALRYVILTRPTASQTLYIQMIGRVARLFKNKTHGTILDIVDNVSSNSAITIPTLFGFAGMEFETKGENILELKKKIEEIKEDYPELNLSKIKSIDELNNIEKEELDIFHSKNNNIPIYSIAEEVSEQTQFAWIKINDDNFKINLGQEEKSGIKLYKNLNINIDILGKYNCEYIEKDKEGNVFTKNSISKQNSLSNAIHYCDNYIKSKLKSSISIADTKANWRKLDASPRQIGFLKKLKVPVPNNLKKGQAEVLINRALKYIERKGKK